MTPTREAAEEIERFVREHSYIDRSKVEAIITRCVEAEARMWRLVLRFQYGWTVEECAREYGMTREQAEEAIRARSNDE